MKASIFPCAIVLTLALGALNAVYADSATWNLNPTNGDWNTAVNWTPETVPNGPADVATFASSSITDLTFSAETTEVAAIVFNPGASRFNITADPEPLSTGITLTISGTGITNNSGVTQKLTVAPSVSSRRGTIEFVNATSAGDGTVLTVFGAGTSAASGGNINFHDTSTAGTATIVAEGALAGDEAGGGEVTFDGNATAGNASFTIDGAQSLQGFAYGGDVTFADFSSAGDAVFVINPGHGSNGGEGTMLFTDNATAANGIFTLNGPVGKFADGANITFFDGATAGNGFFTVNGGQQADAIDGSAVNFEGFNFTGQIVSAGTATIINNGGNGANARGGRTSFLFEAATASQAHLVANGGQNGGGGGQITFDSDTDGGEARIEVYDNGLLSVSAATAITIGSIEGDGLVNLGASALTIGSNNLSTTFAGLIQDAGSITKLGTGILTLSGASIYTGGTTVQRGVLLVANVSGSATGSGPVSVTTGRLGGSGIIAGAVTIGTGSGRGAFLAPATGTNVRATLTIQGALTLNADATYTCTFRAKQNRARTDQVIANGVTINSGAMIALVGHTTGTLTQGIVLTLISNTSADPISGNFSNLPDGSIVTINGNNFQASYEGGDGNDLTLTVVP